MLQYKVFPLTVKAQSGSLSHFEGIDEGCALGAIDNVGITVGLLLGEIELIVDGSILGSRLILGESEGIPDGSTIS